MIKKLIILMLILTPVSVKANMNFDSYIVKDINSNKVFEEKSSQIKKLPASTTKIMTAIVALENSNKTDIVKVGDEILKVDGSNIYLEVGENILMEDLLYGMLLRSGNDAAMSIAKHTGGSINNFIKMMNEKARSLNLYNTIYTNPTGLDDYEENYSTASDLAAIYSYAYQNKDFRKIIKTKTYKTTSDKKSYLFNNRSKILKIYDKSTGAKTGYTPKAGRLLVSSARDNNLDIVIVTIGNSYGYEEHIKKYEEIFKDYKSYLILDKNNFKINKKLKGKPYIKNSFSYPLKETEKKDITKKIVLKNKKNKYIGDINIYKDNEIIHKEKIYLREKKETIWQKIRDKFS